MGLLANIIVAKILSGLPCISCTPIKVLQNVLTYQLMMSILLFRDLHTITAITYNVSYMYIQHYTLLAWGRKAWRHWQVFFCDKWGQRSKIRIRCGVSYRIFGVCVCVCVWEGGDSRAPTPLYENPEMHWQALFLTKEIKGLVWCDSSWSHWSNKTCQRVRDWWLLTTPIWHCDNSATITWL